MIREYRATDQTAVAALIASVLVEFGFSTDTGAVALDLRDPGAGYAGPRAGFWVAEEGGDIVGTVAVRPKEPATCEIKRLYLRKDARGKGLGQALYAHAEGFARKAGYERIWLDSSRRFTQARKLYERNGFTLVAEIDNAWCDNVYEKTLTAEGRAPG